MNTIIENLKSRARVLHRLAGHVDPLAIAELRQLENFALSSSEQIARAATRRHCLAATAQRLGFNNWPQLLDVLQGARLVDFGKLLVPPGSSAYWNVWFADYAEAAKVRAEHGGYLLAYGRQFLVADENFIRYIGLDPHDPDWETIGRDWPNTHHTAARNRLYTQLIQRTLPHLSRDRGEVVQ